MPNLSKIYSSLSSRGNPTIYPILNASAGELGVSFDPAQVDPSALDYDRYNIRSSWPEGNTLNSLDISTPITIAQQAEDIVIEIDFAEDIAEATSSPPGLFIFDTNTSLTIADANGSGEIALSVATTVLNETIVRITIPSVILNDTGVNYYEIESDSPVVLNPTLGGISNIFAIGFEIAIEVIGATDNIETDAPYDSLTGKVDPSLYNYLDLCHKNLFLHTEDSDFIDSTDINILDYTENLELQAVDARKYFFLNEKEERIVIGETVGTVFPCDALVTGTNELHNHWIYYRVVRGPGGYCGCSGTESVEIPILDVQNPTISFLVESYQPYTELAVRSEGSNCNIQCNEITSDNFELFVNAETFSPNTPTGVTGVFNFTITDKEGEELAWVNDSGEEVGRNISIDNNTDTSVLTQTINIKDPETEEVLIEPGLYFAEATIDNGCCSYTTPKYPIYILPEFRILGDCSSYTLSNCGLSRTYYVSIYQPDITQFQILEHDTSTDPSVDKFHIPDGADKQIIIKENLSEDSNLTPSPAEPNGGSTLTNYVEISPGGKLNLDIKTEGVYVIETRYYIEAVVDGSTTFIPQVTYKVIVDMCSIKECILQLLNDIDCDKFKDCEDTRDSDIALWSILIKWFELNSRYQQYIDTINTYTNLESVVDDLSDIDDLVNMIKGYCGDCVDVNIKGDCGCQ